MTLPLPAQFPFLSAVAGSLLHATAVWGVAYTVAPSLIHMEQQRSAGLDGFTAGGSSPTVPFAHPLRCDNPRVAALVSCCPAWQQCCLAAFLVAFPIALAAGSQRWLWARYRQTLPRSHRASHASCAQNDHKRRQQQQQQQQEQHQLVEQRDKAQKQSLIELHRPPDPHGVVELVPAGATDDLAALPDPLFDSWIWSRAITVKVRQGQELGKGHAREGRSHSIGYAYAPWTRLGARGAIVVVVLLWWSCGVRAAHLRT